MKSLNRSNGVPALSHDEVLALLRFYLDCIDEEDRRALCIGRNRLGRSALSPWHPGDRERLFHSGASSFLPPRLDSASRKVVVEAVQRGGGTGRFVYGYPLLLDSKGYLRPLFLTEVEYGELGNQLNAHLVDAGRPALNPHLLAWTGYSQGEATVLQSSLDRESFGSFADRLHATFEVLGTTCPAAVLEGLVEDLPEAGHHADRWVSRPLLVLDARSTYHWGLCRELRTLFNFPSLHQRIKETAAGALFGCTAHGSRSRSADPDPQLCPVLPLNAAQEQALRSSLTQPFTVITGPPGTGKSQVVAALLATCALNGVSVLFASKNNKAVDVVREKLRDALAEHDWSMRLGNRESAREGQSELAGRLASIDSLATPLRPDPQQLHQAEEALADARRAIGEVRTSLRSLNSKAQLSRCLATDFVDRGLSTECPPGAPRNEDLKSARRYARLAALLTDRRSAPLLTRVMVLISSPLLRLHLRTRLGRLLGSLPTTVQSAASAEDATSPTGRADLLALARFLEAYLAWWRAADNERTSLQHLLSLPRSNVLAQRLEETTARQVATARDRLCSHWTGRVASSRAAVSSSLERFVDLAQRLGKWRKNKNEWQTLRAKWHRETTALQEFLPVWCVTSLSAMRSAPLEPGLFDLVVIDEASQCDVPSAIPLLFRARRAVVIGDPQQLQHIATLPSDDEQGLAHEHGVLELLPDLSYTQTSLYLAAEGRSVSNGLEPILLADHFRSHPSIIEFSNQHFYSSMLIPRAAVDPLTGPSGSEIPAFFWHDVHGHVPQSSRSARNDAEVGAVVRLISEWNSSGIFQDASLQIGVVTPFNLQRQAIHRAIMQMEWWSRLKDRLRVGTAHLFQGDEADLVVFSPVVAPGMREGTITWLVRSGHLLNVAVTRAKRALHVVGHRQACQEAGGALSALAQWDMKLSAAAVPALSPAQELMCELLTEQGLWWQAEVGLGPYRLDFLVVSPVGLRYNIEIDGRQHLSQEMLESDAVRDELITSHGIGVIRFDARALFRNRTGVLEVLRRLI